MPQKPCELVPAAAWDSLLSVKVPVAASRVPSRASQGFKNPVGASTPQQVMMLLTMLRQSGESDAGGLVAFVQCQTRPDSGCRYCPGDSRIGAMEVPGIPCCSHDPTSFLTLVSVTLKNWQPWSNCREVPLCFTFLVDARPPVARQLAIMEGVQASNV